MRRLAVAALAGALLFALAVIDSGRRASAADPAAPSDAVASVRDFITLVRHFQASGGDPRVAERLPAAPLLVAEIRGGAEWERHRDELTELEPLRVEILSATGEEGGATVRTREHAIAHTRRRSAPPGTPPTHRAVIASWEYRLVRAGSGWRVVDWKPLLGGEAGP